MPPQPGTGATDRLLLGQTPSGPRGLPPAPVGLPHLAPVPNTQPLLPLNLNVAPPLDLPQHRDVASNEPLTHPIGAQYKGADILHRGFPALIDQTMGKPLEPAEQKALKVLQGKSKLDLTDHVTNAVLTSPGPGLQQAIQQQGLEQTHQAILQHLGAPVQSAPQLPTANAVPSQSELEAQQRAKLNAPIPHTDPNDPAYKRAVALGAIPELAQKTAEAGGTVGQQLTASTGMTASDAATLKADAIREAALVPTSPAALVPKIATEAAQTAVGLGPGLYHLGGGLIHDPLGTTANLVQAIAHSYGQTIHDPMGQLAKDPLGLITNLLTPEFVAAKGATAAKALRDIAEQYKAGAITKIQAAAQIGKTLTPLGDHGIQRQINAGGVRVNPPVFKSSLGALLQTKVLDPLLEKRMASEQMAKGGSLVTGESKVGKFYRRDVEQQLEQQKGVQEVGIKARQPSLPEEDRAKMASASAAAVVHRRAWNDLYNNGAGHDESYAHDPNGYVAIKKPPTAAVSAKGYGSQTAFAQKWKTMVETDPKKIEANPMDYKFIPRGVWDSMNPYTPGGGKIINGINAASQLVRSGRFLHPGYVAWAVQNGILHLSQAGMFAFRNAWQLKNEFSRLTPEEKAVFDGAVGNTGQARATLGTAAREESGTGGKLMQKLTTGKVPEVTRRLGGFWHKVDDQYWRRMSLIHELNREGYHSAEDWAHLMRTDPAKFRQIGAGASNEAINYTEMTPTERNTLAKVMTAYGWTRGATTWTGRFALQHPVQARIGEEVGQEGKNRVDQFYAGLNGMAPSWLRGYLPIGHAGLLASGSVFNPAETPGGLAEAIPGLTRGSNETMLSQAAPVPQGLIEAATGADRFGNKFKGTQRLTQPILDVLHRFEPYAALQTLTSSKKGGGTFKQGWLPALEQYFGTGLQSLNDPKKTASLGEKDYEQSLSKPDEINFRYQRALSMLPTEVQQLATRGLPPKALNQTIGAVKGDLEMVHMRDLYQVEYASQHGSKAWKSLPAINKLNGTIAFISQHHLLPQSAIQQLSTVGTTLKNDKQIETVVSDLWKATGIGARANEWKKTVKAIQPPTLTAARP